MVCAFFISSLQAQDLEKLEKESMLYQSEILAKKFSGERFQWQRPYAIPQPKRICIPHPKQVCEMAANWFAAYPLSIIAPDDKTVLEVLGDDALWSIFEELGINVIHTGPMQLAGQIVDGKLGPSVDGGFDRISYKIDPLFGTEEQYIEMVQSAKKHKALVAGDLVPGHTGKGPDFLLALKDYKDYAGIYHMVEIEEKDWNLLPQIAETLPSKNLTKEQVNTLKNKGYIIGQLQQVYFFAPGVKETNWSASPVIIGADERKRRWVYLHVFKEGQPSLNWLDPTFGANRIVAGDIIASISNYGNKILRLDANAVLGEEIIPDRLLAYSYAHPISIIASDLIAMQTRKLGGFTFQELDTNIATMKQFMHYGADLTYDFISRAAYLHALALGDADLLRLFTRLMQKENLPPVRFIHALQNHDEINMNYAQLNLTPKYTYTYKGKKVKGKDLRDQLIAEDKQTLTGKHAPYNLDSETGPTTTMLGFVAASLGVKDIYAMSEKEKEMVKKAHLLLTFFTAMQPGVFALSGWDLVGALPLKKEQIQTLLSKDQDARWANRGAYDLLGLYPNVKESKFGLARAVTLYGPLPQQLKDPNSYASNLKKILGLRKDYALPLATLVSIFDTQAKDVYLALYKLPQTNNHLLIACNFGNQKRKETLAHDHFQEKRARSIMEKRSVKKEASSDELELTLDPYEGKAILLQDPKEQEDK